MKSVLETASLLVEEAVRPYYLSPSCDGLWDRLGGGQSLGRDRERLATGPPPRMHRRHPCSASSPEWVELLLSPRVWPSTWQAEAVVDGGSHWDDLARLSERRSGGDTQARVRSTEVYIHYTSDKDCVSRILVPPHCPFPNDLNNSMATITELLTPHHNAPIITKNRSTYLFLLLSDGFQ